MVMPAPNFTPADLANIQTAQADFGLANPVDVAWVLYSEPQWSEWQDGLVEAGFEEYQNSKVPFFRKRHKYDGYALVASLSFDDLKNDGDNIGLYVTLPNGSGKDWSGFGFERNSTGYIPISYFVDGETGNVTLDPWWLCSTMPTEKQGQTFGYCYHFQPKKSSKKGGNFRWSSGDVILPMGWTNTSGVVKQFDLTNGTGVTLLGATHIRLALTACALAVSILNF